MSGLRSPFHAWPPSPRSHFSIPGTYTAQDAEERQLLEKHRARKRREEERHERNAIRADALRDRLMGTTWHQKDGTPIEVSKMTPQHAANALRFAQALEGRWYSYALAAGPAYPLLRHSPWPLIEAMKERAAQDPSIRDKAVDWLNTRRYERSRR